MDCDAAAIFNEPFVMRRHKSLGRVTWDESFRVSSSVGCDF